MTTEHINIRSKIVDSREPDIIRNKLIEYGWQQQLLYSGDYMLHTHDFKRLGITRKRVEDLLASIGERFSKQLEEMLDSYDKYIILLEGSWRMVNPANNLLTNRGVSYNTWDSIWNYLRRWQDKGFTIEITVDEGHTIQRLNAIYALYQKEYSMSAKSKDFTDDRILAFPSGCRGQTAKNCLEKFGSLVTVGQQTTEALKTVEKIGDKKARLIFDHFHRGNGVEPTQEMML
jgi:ERCC4-type nuclease